MPQGFGVQSWGADAGGGGGGTLSPATLIMRTTLEGIAPNDPIIFDVVYLSGPVGDPLVTAQYTRFGIGETIYTPENGFSSNFPDATKSPITDGFRFTVRRRGGWPTTPDIQVA